ncbi:MAG TPA: twin-arginine translocation signal domain-containing protein [Anaerolineae bacterium]|nr:twin-arginine translocation signal domain-containing protein [Anaerolineae bacterium]HIQ05822.1 twin-arginine translocation signal domain-containing protein [Anaerolineae bacterium]
MSKNGKKPFPTKITRRDFIKTSAVVGGSLAVATSVDTAFRRMADMSRAFGDAAAAGEYPLNKPENIIYSVCLQCHTACTIKGKLLDGVLVKIDGNPYSPMNMLPHLSYDTPLAEAAKVDAKLCPKGQAGVNTLYDPYRITKVLKRAGKRGENKWEVISFDQAIDEIVNGGSFADGSKTPGLKEVWAVHDPDLMAELKADAMAVASGGMSLDEFKSKHAAHLDLLIDPDHPDLGPKNNQFVFQAGRIEHGRKEFAKRWLKDAFGSVNWYEHTTICEQSHHIAFGEMTNQYKGNGKWSGGKHHLKPDFANAEMVIFFGTGAFEANFGPTPMSELVTWSLTYRNMKMAVVDPRLSKTAAKAKWWLPVKPGEDGALALALGRWIVENERYDTTYLTNANKAAAAADNETTWTNATYLVKIEEGKPTRLLRPAEAGLGDVDGFLVSQNGQLVVVNPNDAENPVEGDLFVQGAVNGIAYKSAFQLYKELTFERSLEEWSDICGIPARKIVEVAREFTSHGKKAAVDLYRGAVQHTNGYYNAQAIIMLNVLIGNADWAGGMGKGGGHWHEDGSKKGQPFNIVKGMHPGKLGSFGVTLTREKWHYEKSTLFKQDGYPAKRPWYPYTGNVYQEIIPSAADGYPYPIQALFLHKGTPGYASPAGNPTLEAIADPQVIPLVIACDVVIGETSMYADYLFPDTAIWERWGTPHTTPAVQAKTSKMRQPIVDPLPEKVTVFGEEQPLSMEAVMLAIAERLGLPGYGKDGFGPGMDFNTRQDYFLKMAANLAFGDKEDGSDAVPEADNEELAIFRAARAHLPKAVFDEERMKKTIGNDESLWRRVVYLLNRGGRFEDFSKVYKDNKLAHQFKGMFSIFVDNVATGKHSLTGENFAGLPIYEPIKDAAGQPLDQEEYPFRLFTYKEIYGGQSRTPGNYWAQLGLATENWVLMNKVDADRLGLKDGEVVKLVSQSNPEGTWRLPNGKPMPIAGKVKAIQGIRPGTVAASWHFGHWAYGASDFVVDGQAVKGDPRRATGLCPNAVMLEDPVLKNVSLTDPIGGSASFYDTRVKVVKT